MDKGLAHSSGQLVAARPAYDRDRWTERQPGEIRGDEAADVHARQRAIERPDIESLARQRLKLPPEWRAVIWSREGDYPDCWGMSVEGGVCPPKTRGKYKGSPNWKAATLKRKFVATDAEVAAHVKQWERRTGNCERCLGTGWRSFGWGCEIGHRYVPCKRCAATGKATTASAGRDEPSSASEPSKSTETNNEG